MVLAGNHHGKAGGGVDRKTNLTLASNVCFGGQTAKWPNVPEGQTVGAFLLLFGMSDPPPPTQKPFFAEAALR